MTVRVKGLVIACRVDDRVKVLVIACRVDDSTCERVGDSTQSG